MNENMIIIEAIIEHFSRTFYMWQEEILNIPEDIWRSGDVDYLIPIRNFCHMA